ncbi:unnamed protein product [Polarella glacialis]|uniref:Chromo domain-containing protein n=1 Tax=Polarella glacialis TaxID=89957 RepID=A0A813JKX5_POLGL|nr:unnamed protein product [Polarella glacialis]CAE8679977.1 unnamed protein product [Polarella glacialis]
MQGEKEEVGRDRWDRDLEPFDPDNDLEYESEADSEPPVKCLKRLVSSGASCNAAGTSVAVSAQSWQAASAPTNTTTTTIAATTATATTTTAPEMFAVERLLRPTASGSIASYWVRWRDFNREDDTPEPRSSLLQDVPEVVQAFEERHRVQWRQRGGKETFTWKQK